MDDPPTNLTTLSNTTASDCSMPAWFDTLSNSLYTTTYYVIAPIYLVLGLIGNILSLLAFRQQAKHERAYLYQLFSTINQLLEVITYAGLIVSQFWWSGYLSEGAGWFKTNYVLMWYTAFMASPAINSFLTSSIFLSLSMTLDRILALMSPFKYRHMNHRLHQAAALSLSWTIGIGTSAFDCLRYVLVMQANGEYKLVINQVYTESIPATVLTQTRNVVRALGLLALVLSNAYLVAAYHKRNSQVTNLTNNNGGQPNASKETQRKETEKTLLTLTIADSLLTSIGMIALIAFYIGVYTSSKFLDCYGRLMAPILDGTLQVTEIVNFYIVLIISKQFRGIVLSVLPAWMKRCVGVREASGTGMMSLAH